jgi:hypothetical protein
MKIRYILPLMVMLIGTGFGQYLTYEEMIYLQKIATDSSKLDKYFFEKGFVSHHKSSNTEYRNATYKKSVDNDNYTISVSLFLYDGQIYIAEMSENEERLDYFNQIVRSFGYKETDPGVSGTTINRITYSNGIYDIYMSRSPMHLNKKDIYILITKTLR